MCGCWCDVSKRFKCIATENWVDIFRNQNSHLFFIQELFNKYSLFTRWKYEDVRHCPRLGPPTLLKNFNPELFLSKGSTGTKSGTETEGKVIQRLPHQGINPICCYQTQTLLLMPRSACWQKPDKAVPCEALPEPDQYRFGCTQPNIRLRVGTPMAELGQGLKELKGFATP